MSQLNGTEGADTLIGTGQDDNIHGWGGNDLIVLELGDDTIVGGTGIDTISFADAMWSAGTGDRIAGFHLDLANTGDQFYRYQLVGSPGHFDIAPNPLTHLRVSEVENILGSRWDDDFAGDGFGNVIQGDGGRDQILGRGGDDTLSGGNGIDFVWGGDGDDRLEGGSDQDYLHGENGRDLIFGDAGFDSLSGGADNDAIEGGAGADTIHGDAGDDVLKTGSSNDAGYYGRDVLYGDEGADTLIATSDVYAADLYGGEGRDILQALGGSAVRMIGGAGADTFYGQYGAAVSYHDAVEAVGINRDTNIHTGADALGDVYYGVTKFELSNLGDRFQGADFVAGDPARGWDDVSGGGGDDTLIGGAGNDDLKGDGGADFIVGGVGADNILGGDGADVLYGEDDADHLYGGAGADSMYGGDGDDVLNGEYQNSVSNDLMFGGAGRDQVEGYGGNDTIYGEDGDDYLSGGEGDDSVSGGAGADTFAEQRALGGDTVAGGAGDDLYYTNAAYGTGVNTKLTIIEQAGEGWDTVKLHAYSREWTLADNVEELDATATAAATGARKLSGNAVDNLIRAAADNDSIAGLGGADTLDGGAGNDTLDGGAGADSLQGGEGADLLWLGAGDRGVGGAGTDTFVLSRGVGPAATIQDFSHASGDRIDISAFVQGAADPFASGVLKLETRSDGVAIVYADASMPGAARDIVLIKGLSASQLTGSDFLAVSADGSGVVIDPQVSGGPAPILGTSSADWLEGGVGADTLDGLAGNDNLLGGAGDDVLIGGAGNDNLNGEAGADTASYETATSGVVVNLDLKTAQATGGAGSDKLTSIENLKGSAFGDQLTGDAGANHLAGGDGADLIFGAGGADTLEGGAGADTVQGGDGADRIDGGDGVDDLYGGAGLDRFVFRSLDGDSIKDWAQGEVIDVSAVHAVSLSLSTLGGQTRIEFDIDGDGQHDDGIIFVTGVVTAHDILL